MITKPTPGSDRVLTKTTEVRMKHFDHGQDYNEAVVAEQNLIAKEASYIQTVGYTPTTELSQREWEQMQRRNKMSRGVYQGEPENPRRSR